MEKNKKIGEHNIILVDIQLICTIVTVILLIWYIFNSKVLVFLELFLGLSLISMAVNNHYIYKRKKATILYAIVGGLQLLLTILMLLGV